MDNFAVRNYLIEKEMSKLSKQTGISLIEVLLAITTIVILVILISALPNSIGLVAKANHQNLAREIATKKIEDLRGIQYANLANGESLLSDSRLGRLPNGRGLTLIEDCDPLICTQGENAKQVTVTLSWKEGDKEAQVKLKTLISAGGLNQ